MLTVIECALLPILGCLERAIEEGLYVLDVVLRRGICALVIQHLISNPYADDRYNHDEERAYRIAVIFGL